MSRGSPRMSDRTMEYTRAGAHSWAKRPPFTADSRLRMVFISTMSAPQDSSSWVSRARSSAGTRGRSNRAEPPPDTRKITVSSAVRPDTRSMAAWVPWKEPSSGTGWPPSQMAQWGMFPMLWPCLVTTTPAWSRSPSRLAAQLAICQAALPAATRQSFPGPKSFCSSARRTAWSGRQA